ncbi:orexin receptor type 2-like [Mya arenaria]|uniref:orexin receptor type 2-like n=1 Tax=Mya arenaria TaxID=6604 RepID=UPI0022E07FD2|nr:orexin receptor type 2-like [Mya arenaria]
MDAVSGNETNYIAWNSSVDLYTDCTEDATENRNVVCLCRNSNLRNILECFIPEPEEWVLVFAYVITFVIGVFGNILVCFAVCRNKDLQTNTNIFIVNLAVADLTVILVLLPSALIVDVTDTWLFGGAMCKISIAIGTMCITVSILTLCAISVERWYAICQLFSFHSNIQRARITIAAIWAVSICVALPEFLAFTVIPYRPDTVFRTICYPALWEQRTMMIFQICLLVSLYFLPLVLIACVYVHIYVVLWMTRIPDTGDIQMESVNESRQPNTEFGSRLLSRRKTVKMLVTIVVVFALCFLPNHTLSILTYMEKLRGIPNLRMFALISHWCTFFNSCINPIIYIFMSDKFRKEFHGTLSLCCSCGKTQTQGPGVRYQMTCSETSHLTIENSNIDSSVMTK